MTRPGWVVGWLIALIGASPCLAMNNYDDPRVVLSYMDQSIEPARDILRLTTDASEGGGLVFQVKMRGDGSEAGHQDYLLLQVWQERAHQWLVPLDPDAGLPVLAYQGRGASTAGSPSLSSGPLNASPHRAEFTSKHIARGVEFAVPLSWLDYGKKIGFDAYTVTGTIQGDSFVVEEVHDRAAKGDRAERRISPIALLNNLCATRR